MQPEDACTYLTGSRRPRRDWHADSRTLVSSARRGAGKGKELAMTLPAALGRSSKAISGGQSVVAVASL